MIYDFCVIGGGILGLATAMRLLEERPGASLILIEKEAEVALHQTGHNSGVIHAGVYYAPGSLKAELCKQGAEATKQFAAENEIPVEVCGKLIVATNPIEVERLGDLHRRGEANGLRIERLSAPELREREPLIAGKAALFVASTGITNYRLMSAKMAEKIRRHGAELRLGAAVDAIREQPDGVEVEVAGNQLRARKLVVCAGLQSDRLARLAGIQLQHAIVPFRGEYFVLDERINGKLNHLIYPVPDPAMPFLGIHLTKMIDGRVTVGPNAALGFSREGYRHGSFDLRDTAAMMGFPGFWKTIAANWRAAASELKNSISRAAYLAECRKYCPSLQLDDLKPYPAGIRAQAVLADGSFAHDFLFHSTDRMLHVCNAPSPAATSAIPIARLIVDKLLGAAI